MYHSLTRLTAVFAAVLAAAAGISACGADTPAKITIETSQYETDAATVYIERPIFSRMDNAESENALNAEYETEINERLTSFETSDAAEPLAGGNKRVLEITQTAAYNSGNIISIVSEIYDYEGGAHGQRLRRAKTADVSLGSLLKLEDLFADDGYKDALNRLIEAEAEKNPEEYSNLWEKPIIKDENSEDFYLTSDALVIFYQPYDLSYYARGFVEFTIDYTDISSYLKDEYREELIE